MEKELITGVVGLFLAWLIAWRLKAIRDEREFLLSAVAEIGWWVNLEAFFGVEGFWRPIICLLLVLGLGGGILWWLF